jgi:SAM-dependent methyltransferase
MNILKDAYRRLRKQAKLVKYGGNRYTCPFCNYSAREMEPAGEDVPVNKEKEIVGAGIRDAGCYKCGSLDRERLIYFYLRDYLKVFENKDLKILHMAPEKRLSAKLLEVGFSKYVCGDYFTEGYSYPEHVQHIDILHIPFENETFDFVICNHVLEHIPTDVAAMVELRRVLKKGGKAILQVPISKNSPVTFEDLSVTDPKQREIVFGQFDHLRIYGQDYPVRLASGGFKVDRINISSQYAKYGVNIDEDIFIGNK